MQLPPTITPTVIPAARSAAGTVDTRPIDATVASHLTLGSNDPTGFPHVSAASALAAAGGAAWVVSDRYGELVRFEDLATHGTLLPGLEEKKERPDLESLVAIPDGTSGGSLLVSFGSGSKKHRDRALTQAVDASGSPVGGPRESSLKALYAELDSRLPLQPNIEGLALRDGAAGAELLVFHRGKLAEDVNTIFRLDAARVVEALRAGQPVPADVVLGQTSIELGSLGGHRLGFADARVLGDGRIAFAASAEGSDAVGDGTITGSAVGILDSEFNVQVLRPLTGPARKVEGLELTQRFDPSASATSFTLVTDPDDPAKASEVLTVDLAAAPN
jgi:hypothetical protein